MWRCFGKISSSKRRKGQVPGPAAEVVEELLLDLARRHLKRPVEGLVGRDHTELFVQHEQGFTDRLHDAGGHAKRGFDDPLRLLHFGDVLKRQHEPVDDVLGGAIRQDPA